MSNNIVELKNTWLEKVDESFLKAYADEMYGQELAENGMFYPEVIDNTLCVVFFTEKTNSSTIEKRYIAEFGTIIKDDALNKVFVLDNKVISQLKQLNTGKKINGKTYSVSAGRFAVGYYNKKKEEAIKKITSETEDKIDIVFEILEK